MWWVDFYYTTNWHRRRELPDRFDFLVNTRKMPFPLFRKRDEELAFYI